MVQENEICDFMAGIHNLPLDTSKFFGLQVVENRYKLRQVTCKTYASEYSFGLDESIAFWG